MNQIKTVAIARQIYPIAGNPLALRRTHAIYPESTLFFIAGDVETDDSVTRENQAIRMGLLDEKGFRYTMASGFSVAVFLQGQVGQRNLERSK